MRGKINNQSTFVFAIDIESKIKPTHPLRKIKSMADEILLSMDKLFDEMYPDWGRESIPPERLLKAKLLQALYSVRSVRQICDRLETDLLFRWFLDMNPDEEVFDASTFSQNQERLLKHQIANEFLNRIVLMARTKGLVSDEHFSVDGTLVEAWASMKSFRPKDESNSDDQKGKGNGWKDFKGEKRTNETHESKTDPQAKLLKKSKGAEAKLAYLGNTIMENRNGLCVGFDIVEGIGVGETKGAIDHVDRLKELGINVKTLGADKGYHNHTFIEECKKRGISPHVALISNRKQMNVRQGIGYRISQVIRKRIEEIHGWLKTVGRLRKTLYRKIKRIDADAKFNVCALNLLRISKLIA
jgi:transposase